MKKPMKILSTKTILIAAIILTLVLIGLNYFFFMEIKNINTRTSLSMNDVEMYKKEQESLAGRNGIAEIASLVEKVNSYFVGKDGVVGFIENIESEARSEGLVLLIRSVGTENFGGASDEESVGATKEVMRLKLEARGSWQGNMEFISFLEHLPYKVSFESVGISRSLDGENAGGSSATAGSGTVVTASPEWRSRIELTVLKQK